MKYFYGVLMFAFIFTSCGTMRINKTSDFATIKDLKEINGYYLNRGDKGRSILSCFNVRECADFVSITFENSNEVKLTYYNDSTKQERIFLGQMKKKYFEIYFSKQQFFIPLLYSSCNIDRIRIGKSKDGKLLIRNFGDQSGNLLFLAAGYSYETPYKFPNISHIPIQENGLWGYSDLLGHIVIPAKYDFASIFEKDIARVRLNDKWGLINKQGEEVTSIKYDKIFKIDTISVPATFRVSSGGKTGVLDIDGKELIPVIYDYIGYNAPFDRFATIRLGDKVGCATHAQVIIPAIYSEIIYFHGDQVLVKRHGKYYIADKDGYEYETTGIWIMRNPIPETKRKIQFDEQKVE